MPMYRAKCPACGESRVFQGANASVLAQKATCLTCGRKLTPEAEIAPKESFIRRLYESPPQERCALTDDEWQASQALLIQALGP